MTAVDWFKDMPYRRMERRIENLEMLKLCQVVERAQSGIWSKEEASRAIERIQLGLDPWEEKA